MSILTLPPAPSFSASRFALISHSRVFKSLFDNSVQTEQSPGARWSASFTLPVMKRSQAAVWQAFGVQLRGMAGRFYGYDPDYAVLGPQGTPTGAPLVDGGGQSGTTLVTKGFAPDTRIFEAGDQFAFDTPMGRELKMITQAVDSDVNGDAALIFEPPMRNVPDNEAVIITDKPSCVMMIEEDVFGWESDALIHYQISFNAIEVFR